MAGVKGRSGRPRKSTAELKANGGYRPVRHENRADQLIEGAKLICPKHLKAIGKKAWKRIVEALPEQMLTNLDAESLSMYCDLIECYHNLRPQFIADPIDKDIRLSYFAVVNGMDRVGRQFGWTPQSRAGLHIVEQKEESPFAEYLKGRMGASVK